MLTLHGTRVILDEVETNFDVRELVTPTMYEIWGAQCIRFLQEAGVRWLQFSRDWFGAPHYVNNWHKTQPGHRAYTLRGVRPYHTGFFTMLTTVHGTDVKDTVKDLLQDFGIDTDTFQTGSWDSIHKNGGAYDYTVKDLTANEVREEIHNNEQQFMNAGLTTLEHREFAPTWTHGDNRPTGLNKILIVKPARSQF